MQGLVGIKCCLMWLYIPVICGSVCVVNIIFETEVVSVKNKHDSFWNWVGKDVSCYHRNEQSTPHFL